jgi:hypothetical protein
MAQKLIAELDQIKTDGALPAAERQRLVAQLTAKTEQLGRIEESLIEKRPCKASRFTEDECQPTGYLGD